jgi:hypothetical protein
MVDPENLSASARMHIKWLCVRKSLSAVRGEDAPVLLLHVTASSCKLAYAWSRSWHSRTGIWTIAETTTTTLADTLNAPGATA